METVVRSLGLGGDGDEIDAIEAVERAFGIGFDIEDCERFETVGDVWDSLCGELRVEESAAAALWPRFAAAISDETGVDPERVGRETRLLGEPLAAVLKRAIRRWFGRE